MAYLHSIGFALPPFQYSQRTVYETLVRYYPESFRSKFDILEVFKNSQVQNRFFIVSLEELDKLGNFIERNQLYLERGIELCTKAIQDCLDKANISASEIDTLLMVSSTGFVVPSLETHLIHSLGFSPQIQRIPIVGWGCTGGVAGLNSAMQLAQGNPHAKILLVNLELCSLAFQAQDLSSKSVIANAIFNDGASASLIVGKNIIQTGSLELIDSHRHLFAKTSHLMGWEQLASGLQVILSPEIPSLAYQESKSFVSSLINKHSFTSKDIRLWLFHPGGAKILQALQKALELSPEAMALSWSNLKQYGNMSSCSIFAGLQSVLKNPDLKGPGVLCAFGPGFACEGLLFSK